MAVSLTGNMRVVFANSFANNLDISTVTEQLSKTYAKETTSGTGQNKANVQWHDTRTLTTGATETLDLQALAGAAFGTVNLSKIKALVINVTTTTTGYTLKLKAGASNGFSACFSDPSDELVITNNGLLALFATGDGYTVDATHKTILLTNPAGGSLTYDIIIVGEGSVS